MVHACLLAILVLAYCYVVRCDFINLDDSGYVYANPFVKEGLSWGNLATAFTTFVGAFGSH
jgi:hypothetical protein